MMATDWKILQAHIVELEELEDDLLRSARGAAETAKVFLPVLHRHIMEKRRRLREMQGN